MQSLVTKTVKLKQKLLSYLNYLSTQDHVYAHFTLSITISSFLTYREHIQGYKIAAYN